MRNLLIIIMICVVMALLSCSGEEAECPVAACEPSIEELEARVIANCNIFRDALVEYKDSNHGYCPVDIYNETNDLGLTVIDYLPDGELMENPFTGERTEPVDTLATEPGQTGYFQRYSWGSTLYYINGFGESHTIVEMSNTEEIEQAVIVNCLLVQQAAEMFAAHNSGIYPSDVGTDTTPGGLTLVDFLPARRMLNNPIHLFATEPVDGTSCNPGETAYVTFIQNATNTGYAITGTGIIAGTTNFTWWQSADDTCITINGVTVYCTE